MQLNKRRFQVRPHIPRGSGDAEYRIVDTESDNHDPVVIVDPNMAYDDPAGLADEICDAMNAAQVLGG